MNRLAADQRLVQLLAMLAPERRTRIADIGARDINKNPYRPLLAAGAAELWGFEPAEDAFAELRARARPNEHYLPDAVGDGGTGQLRVCRGGGYSSLLEPDTATLDYLGRWHRMMRVVDRVALRTTRLDDVAALPRVDLLKIDIQGGELAAFRGARDRLSEAVVVITEVAFLPLYVDQPTLADQMAALSAQGFVLHKFLHQSARVLLGRRAAALAPRAHRNQLIDGDAVFVRDPRKPADMTDAQLKHLALLADAVFQSFDLALFAIDRLVERGAIAESAADAYTRALPDLRPEP